MQTHYIICSSCSTSNPTEGWWDTNEHQETMEYMDPSQNMEIDTLRDDPLLGLGLQHIEDPEEDNVSSILMKNGSRQKRANRGQQMVSVGNLSGHF